ncbi:hypothetical protein Aph01nite_26080 [Acrocarpospora phusangensis]|uniref:Secreted protein n=1 Tax=Acrocarpospora phusangensis TaxID=1070424 RepID=A0A919QBF5_9ACTN|nr:hypothetical protein [Acrocarpospora phusangensis]GIH24298.1 hypothetical protein Aph01nite_26080 [Acrocarpospora phusangensis]
MRTILGTALGLLMIAALAPPAAAAQARRAVTVHSAWVAVPSGSAPKRDTFTYTLTRQGSRRVLDGTLRDRHGEGSSAYLYISWSPRESWVAFHPGESRVHAPGSTHVTVEFNSPRSVKVRVCDKVQTASRPGCGAWKTVVG